MRTRAMKWRNVLVTCLGLGGIVASVACNPDVKVGDEAGGAGSTASAGLTTSGSVGTAAPGSAACAAPAGEVHVFGSAKEVYDALLGDWQICDGVAAWPAPPADMIGVQFGPASADLNPNGGGSTIGGKMYYLVQGPSGPVPGEGFGYQLTYDLSPEGSSFQLNMHPTPQSGFGGPFLYSASPRQFSLTWDFGSPSSRLIVPF